MKIGELASRSGLSTQAIRYYEDIGVLPEPERATNGYRVYDGETEERLSFIRDAQTSGLSLTEIQIILEMKDEGESTCGHVIAMLEGHLGEVDRQIDELYRTKQRLRGLIGRARELDPAECDDPNRCQTISGERVTV